MNFITEKIQYDEASQIYWTRLFYSVEGKEATAIIGATRNYLYELFKKPAGTELGSGFMNKWLKITMQDLAKELPKTNTGNVFIKMYGSSSEEIKTGEAYLESLSDESA